MSKTQAARLEFWRQLIAKQQQSGTSVRALCQQHRTSEFSFYHWRKRLREQLPIELNTPRDVQRELSARFKARRLAMNLTQEGLAARSGVSWSSLKRFEYTWLIALDALLKLSLVLGCLSDFGGVCTEDKQGLSSLSLDELLSKPKTGRKGQIK